LGWIPAAAVSWHGCCCYWSEYRHDPFEFPAALNSGNTESYNTKLRADGTVRSNDHRHIGDNLELYHNNSVTSNFSGRTNTSYKTTTGLRFEITDLLYANLSLDYEYESHPVEPALNEDIALLIGLGAEF
jgi:hypothetical protein